MAAPGGFRCQCGVVIGEIVERYGRIESGIIVPTILPRQSQRIVFRMAGDECQALISAGEQVGASQLGFGQNIQVGILANHLGREIGIT